MSGEREVKELSREGFCVTSARPLTSHLLPLTLYYLDVTTPSPPSPPRRRRHPAELLRAALELFTTVVPGDHYPRDRGPRGCRRGNDLPALQRERGPADLRPITRRKLGAGADQRTGRGHGLPPRDRLLAVARRLVSAARRDPAMTRMLLRRREQGYLDDSAREAARHFREALQQIVASGKQAGWCAGPGRSLDFGVARAGGVRGRTGQHQGVVAGSPAGRR